MRFAQNSLVLLAAALAWAQPQPPSALPTDLSLTIRLETVLDAKQLHVGDPLTAMISKDVKVKGKIVVPKKAAVHGRVRFLDSKKGQVVYGLQFEDVEIEGAHVPLALELTEIVTELPGSGRKELPSVTRSAAQTDGAGSTTSMLMKGSGAILPNNTPGIGTFVIQSEGIKLKDFESVWRTIAPPK